MPVFTFINLLCIPLLTYGLVKATDKFWIGVNAAALAINLVIVGLQMARFV